MSSSALAPVLDPAFPPVIGAASDLGWLVSTCPLSPPPPPCLLRPDYSADQTSGAKVEGPN
uniref:Uncharacterized protein n=1 Tax=Oryza sativa subsp. japonica TaxID=39947 RepID=Q6H8G9_ORYSJ|nr:hypothetical protein [Oryza sativa Japonica Group]